MFLSESSYWTVVVEMEVGVLEGARLDLAECDLLFVWPVHTWHGIWGFIVGNRVGRTYLVRIVCQEMLYVCKYKGEKTCKYTA